MINQKVDSNDEQAAVRPVQPYTREEILRLLGLPDCPILVVTALYTGMRQGELYGLTWTKVGLDSDLPHIKVSGPRCGAGRMVPIHPELLPVLRTWQRDCPPTTEGLVFARKFDSGGRWIRDLLARARIASPARPFHAFRRSLTVHMMDACQDLRAVCAMLGHRSGADPAEREVTKPPTVATIYQALCKMTFKPAA